MPKDKNAMSFLPIAVSSSHANPHQANPIEEDPQPRTTTDHQEQPAETLIDISQFKLKWDRIYSQSYMGITAGDMISKKESLSPKLRPKVAHEIIRQAIDAKISNLTRESLNHIYYQLVLSKHPESFQTLLASGEKSSGGFLHVLKYCFDNQKRPDRNKHLQHEDFMKKQYEQPRGKYAYGCVRWRVRDDIPGQTAVTEKDQKEKMVKIYLEVRAKFWDWSKLTDMMRNTFKAQREMINKNITDALQEQKKQLSRKRRRPAQECDDENPDDDLQQEVAKVTIKSVAEEWPLLFSYQGMLIHFELLTDINLEKEFHNFKGSQKREVLLEFFKNLDREEDDFYHKTFKKMESKNKKPEEENHDFKAIIVMLARYFKESSFIEVVEVSYNSLWSSYLSYSLKFHISFLNLFQDSVTMEVLNEQRQAPQYPALTAPGKAACLKCSLIFNDPFRKRTSQKRAENRNILST